MEIPVELQERTDSLFQELQSELGKHGANQFVQMRTAIHFEENTSVINPQELMNTGSPNTEDFWDKYVSSPPADDSDPSGGDATSNKDLYEILGLPLALKDNASSSSNTPVDGRSLSFEASQDIPLCKRCNCKICKRRLDRAKKKGKKQGSLDAVAKQFPKEDLIDFFDKYWETLKLYGLFSDQSGEPFKWSAEVNCPAYVQRRQYHLILRHLETEDDLQQWRRSIAEYQTLEGYNEFHREATKQRLSGMQVRASGENDNNKAHKEYVKHMFPDKHPESLSTTLAAFKKDLQFARRWAIWVQGYVEKKDGLGVPGLSVGVFLVAGPEIKRMMCARISSGVFTG
jgi:hypothetical protein